ncbi:Stk1 family PASTA domain-containing Ser/Thr kinase [Peribacillus sp. FSL H8-0477]|uniref:Stk1 family PASTA domain-containing Ser/Thr kinase n=1 Tax=Peribacillus sp. FSL H8-0477 TaxID=2921388 RepID=UPI0030FBCBD1
MLIGKRINGRYKLLDMVGGGGMANVYLARDMILDRDVALKILRMDFNNDDEFIKRFNREAQSATSLVHPNIVSIYDVGEDGDIYYIVMEYVKGLTLKQYIQKNFPLSIEESINIMEQITAAISNAHHNGIIHRDIKPQNILVDEIGNVKITDFGIALALSATNITQTNAVLGSVHYLSPEQARGGMANKKSDIYSLGIVMFELLTGRLPFSGESAVSIALKHLQSETPSPKRWNPDIPQSVENIILKATAKDSYYRYESVDEMHEQIRTSLKPERLNEPVFAIPEDHDATKAIPIITNDHMNSIDETIIRGPEKNTAVYDEASAPVKSVSKKKGANSKKQKKRKKRPLLMIASLLVILLLLGGSFVFFPALFGPKEITIPDLSGEEYDDAIVELLKSGLEPGKTIELSDEKVPQEQVIKTEPRAGRVVKEGTTIDIYQSTGKETVTVSDYIGRNIDSIETLLDKMDFKKSMISEEFDDSSPGTILTQVPSLNTEVVPSDTAFEFTVSKGPEQLPLKNLTEFNKAGLDDYAKEAGIKVNVKREEYNASVGFGLVISQEPSPGTKVEKGSTVNVVLSKGKKEIPPKKVTKEVTIEYDPLVPGEVQIVKIYIEDMNHSMTEPEDTIELTENRTVTLEFLVPYEKQAGYKIIRDGSVYLENIITYPKK